MNNTIITLKGPDRVRKRPAVIFGEEGVLGAIGAIRMLLDVFFTEAAVGCCEKIKVTLHKDSSLSIESSDRGIILSETPIDSNPAWHYVFCDFGAPGSRNGEFVFESVFSKHSDLFGKSDKNNSTFVTDEEHGFDLCCVQCVCEFMKVVSVRAGEKKHLSFSKGYSSSKLTKESAADPNGTCVHFKLDSDVFGDISTPKSAIINMLKEAAITIPGLRTELYDQTDNTKSEYFFPAGALDYANSIKASDLSLYDKTIEVCGKDRYNRPEYNARVRVLVGFGENSEVECFHNRKKLLCGGAHLNAVKEKLIRNVNDWFSYENQQIDTVFKDVCEKLILIIVSDSTFTEWETGRKDSIKNKMIADMATDLINDDFVHYLKQNKEKIQRYIK